MEQLNKIFASEIAQTTLDLSIDYSEAVLDDIIEDGILKEIPIIKTVASVISVGIKIRERHFAKKFFTFLREFHSKVITDENLNSFINKFNSDSTYREKITEHILVYNDKFLQIEKSKILANLFLSYVERRIDWDLFSELSECLEKLQYKGLIYLVSLSEGGETTNSLTPKWKEYRKQKLESGATEADLEEEFKEFQSQFRNLTSNQTILYAAGAGFNTSSWSSSFNLSELGKNLLQYGLERQVPSIPEYR